MTKEEAVAKLHELGYSFRFIPENEDSGAMYTFVKKYPEYDAMRAIRVYRVEGEWTIQNEECCLHFKWSITTLRKTDFLLFAAFVEGLK